MASALQLQFDRCHEALKALARCSKERRWHKVVARSDRVVNEMTLLQLKLTDSPELDDALAEQVRYLDVQSRRVQRQLSIQMNAISDDMEILQRGISRADAGKALLQTQ